MSFALTQNLIHSLTFINADKYQADSNFIVVFTMLPGLHSHLLTHFVFFTAKSSMFVESCHFEEENICGMIQGAGNNKWDWRASVDGGPQTDFSYMGECTGERSSWTHVDSVATARVGHGTES